MTQTTPVVGVGIAAPQKPCFADKSMVIPKGATLILRGDLFIIQNSSGEVIGGFGCNKGTSNVWADKTGAEKHDPNSLYALANRHLKGDGVAVNPEEALKLFTEAANLGHHGAEYEAGSRLISSKTPREQIVGRDFLTSAITSENLSPEQKKEAQYQLGHYYMHDGKKPDDLAAENFLKQASDAGHTQAKFELANLYGKKPEKDAEVVKLYNEAAKAGHTGAEVALGDIYRDGGLGQNKDLKKALEYYESAQKHGVPNLKKIIGDIKKEMTMQPERQLPASIDAA